MKLYHATYTANVASIIQKGFLINQRKSWADCADDYIYLSDDPEVSISFCEIAEDVTDEIYSSGICCFEINSNSLDKNLLFADPNILDASEESSSCYAYAGNISFDSARIIQFIQNC